LSFLLKCHHHVPHFEAIRIITLPIKGLIGISPNGYPSFVSSLYAGRTSDKKITRDCGILNLLEPGDELMADRGFDFESDMPNGVFLNIPPFLDGQPQLSAEDEAKTRKIASVRVYVEHAK
jgi:hypothetical protein